MWRNEGQKLASTNPRFVARQLSHLPQLLTSAAVSSALSLQNARADPDLRKNTSVQVQNVLKFIISQNPLNTTSAAKQQLGKISLSHSGGKTLVKSPSKSPAVSEASSTSVGKSITTRVNLSTTTASPIKKDGRPPTTQPRIGNVPISSPGKPSSISLPLSSLVKSEISSGKTSKVSGGGKSSMLVGLLEGRSDTSREETNNVADTPEKSAVHSETQTDNEIERKKVDEMEREGEEEKEKEEGVMEQDKDETTEKEGQSKSDLSETDKGNVVKKDFQKARLVEEMQVSDEVSNPKIPETDHLKKHDTESDFEKHKIEVLKKTEPNNDTQVDTKGKEVEFSVEGEKSTELVCEEMMPESTQPRQRADVTPTTTDALAIHTRDAEEKTEASSVSQMASTSAAGDKTEMLPVSNAVMLPVFNAAQSGKLNYPQEALNDERPLNSLMESKSSFEAEEVKEKTELRKRPCPTDLNLSPPHKKARVVPPQSRPIPALTPVSVQQPPKCVTSEKLPKPSLQMASSFTTATTSSSLVTQSPGPPPLLLVPPSVNFESQQQTGGVREGTDVSSNLQVGQVPPLKMLGSVTIQPLLSSLTLPTTLRIPQQAEALESSIVSAAAAHMVSNVNAFVSESGLKPLIQPSSLSIPVLPPIPSFTAQPSPIHNLTSLSSTPMLQSIAFSASEHLQTISTPITSTTLTPSSQPVVLTTLQESLAQPLTSQKPMTPSEEAVIVSNDVTMMSSTSDEALIRELCSEATEETTAAALASQLGLEFLDQNLLGIDLMQLVNSPLETKTPTLSSEPLLPCESLPSDGTPSHASVEYPGVGSGVNTPALPDTSQLLSEALISLSAPSTPLVPGSSISHFNPLFPTSPSTESPILPPKPQHQEHTSPFTPSLLTSHSISPFATHTPTILTPHTPSLSSPLTPEILPDLESLSGVNEADLLEGIPPELAETIQALAQFDQHNYQSPLR